MKTCQNCGAIAADSDMFCPKCGAKIEVTSVESEATTIPTSEPEVAATSTSEPEVNAAPTDTAANATSPEATAIPPVSSIPEGGTVQSDSSNNKKLFLIVACIAVAIVLVIVLFASLFGGNGSSSKKHAVEDFYEALVDMDADDFLDLIPKDCIEYIKDENDYTTKYLKGIVDDNLFYYMEDEDIEKIRVKCGDSEKIDKDDYEDVFDGLDELGMDVDKIKQAVTYDVTLKYYYDDDKETEEVTATVFK